MKSYDNTNHSSYLFFPVNIKHVGTYGSSVNLPTIFSLAISPFLLEFISRTMSSFTTISFPILVEVIRKLDTEGLIEYLQGEEFKDIPFNKSFFERLREEKIIGHLFLMLIRKKFREFGMEIRPALELEELIKNLGKNNNNYGQIFFPGNILS